MKKPDNKIKGRLFTSMLLVSLIFFGLFLRLGYWQIYRGEELKAMAEDRKSRSIKLDAKRGEILDRNGVPLAISVDTNSVWVITKLIEDKPATAKMLSEITGDDEAEILARISSDKKDVKAVKWIDKDMVNLIKSERHKGVSIYKDVKRVYPYNNFAASVLGNVTDDQVGRAGIEYKLNDRLQGKSGVLITDTDKDGKQLAYASVENHVAEDGENVVLTIDEIIQHFTEKALEKGDEIWKPKMSLAIVMDVKTGEILAMASKPDYNPNDAKNLSHYYDEIEADLTEEELVPKWNEMWKNPNVNNLYEPGSTIKLITAAVGLEESVTTPYKQYFSNGYKKIGDKTIKCWSYKHPHGEQTLTEAVQNSCNPVFVDVVQDVGTGTFYKYFEDFGFNEKVGVQLSSERPYNHSLEDTGPVELATMSYGHGMTVTPLHTITAISSLVNGGRLMEPHIVKRTVDNDGNVIEEFEPNMIKQVVSQKTSQEMKTIMESVVTDGSGKKANIPGIRVGGKTGTAEKFIDGHYVGDKALTSFIGFAPMDDPQIAVYVMLDEPQGATYGSVVAAPIFKDIMEDVLRYKSVKPDTGKARMVQMPNVVGMTVSEAKKAVEKKGMLFTTEPLGVEDDTVIVISQFPSANATVGVDTMVVLKLED